MRDALSLLDCCLSYTDGPVTLSLARDVMGSTGRAFMFDFADALLDFDCARALMLIHQMADQGRDPQVFAREAAAHLRALILAGTVGDISSLLEITPEDAARFSRQAARASAEQLSRLMELYMRAEPDMKWASHPRTVLELATVRACHPEQEPDASLSERMARMERLLEKGVVAASAASPAPSAAPAAEAPRPAEPAKKSAARAPSPDAPPPQSYLDALEAVAKESPSIRATLPSMRFVRFENGTVEVEFPRKSIMHMKMLERKKALLDTALSTAFGQPVSIRMTLEGSAAPVPATGAVARRIIEEAYDVFGRENIDITD